MSQLYLNSPSRGCAISAEEFAARACRRPGCAQAAPDAQHGCGGDCRECPEDGRRPDPGHSPQPPRAEEGCCCKRSFRDALGLLCGPELSSLLDFDAAAFLTSDYSAGAALDCGSRPGHGPGAEAAAEPEDRRRSPCPPCSGGASDNLGPLTGSFRRFAPCTCDLLDIEAELHTPWRGDCGLTAAQVSLCQLDAVAIQGALACAEGGLTAGEAAARSFRCLRQRLARRLNPGGGPCGQDGCACACSCDGRECCCAAGLLAALAQNSLSRRVSLAAGLLVLQDVTLLGTVGSVLVLSNDTDNRLYFVCVNSVQFIG